MTDSPSIKKRLSLVRPVWREMFDFLFLIIAIYTAVNLASERAVVEGASMEPNFFTNQWVVIDRLAYTFGRPTRGDVVVLHDPEDPSVDFIKRVVGLPGEEVTIQAGRVYINGTQLSESYIPRFCISSCEGVWKLDATHYFVLGDNRPNSHDSHAFGPLAEQLIVGKAWLRYWPLSDFGFIPAQSYTPINATPISVPPLPTATFAAPLHQQTPFPLPTVAPRHSVNTARADG